MMYRLLDIYIGTRVCKLIVYKNILEIQYTKIAFIQYLNYNIIYTGTTQLTHLPVCVHQFTNDYRL